MLLACGENRKYSLSDREGLSFVRHQSSDVTGFIISNMPVADEILHNGDSIWLFFRFFTFKSC